jgi:hypothetical protein
MARDGGEEEVFSFQCSVKRANLGANFGGGWFLVGGGRIGGIVLNGGICLMGNGGSFVVASLKFGELPPSSGGIS